MSDSIETMKGNKIEYLVSIKITDLKEVEVLLNPFCTKWNGDVSFPRTQKLVDNDMRIK